MMASIASDNPVERIRHNLVGLRMPRALEALGGVIQQLERGQLGAIEAIDILLAEELTVRESRRIKAALQMARLATIKTLSGFDFSFQPSLDRNRIMALASLDFVDKHEVVHLIGQSGTGKSHLAVALGVEAIRAGAPSLGAAAMVRRAPEPDNRLTAGASGTIPGLALGIGHRSLTKWLARHSRPPIVTSRKWCQSI